MDANGLCFFKKVPKPEGKAYFSQAAKSRRPRRRSGTMLQDPITASNKDATRSLKITEGSCVWRQQHKLLMSRSGILCLPKVDSRRKQLKCNV